MSDIDFVITWVDGADPAHEAARRRYRSESVHPGAASEIRFNESGEIYYLIASILKYAPFVRKIFIITDNQKPKWLDAFAEAGLCDASFLQLVSHDVIFCGLDATRPTFNSRSIEAVMWRIPELSENFVYSNDDMFLNAPMTPNDFFRNRRPVLHGHMMRPDRHRLTAQFRKIINGISGRKDARPKHRVAQEKGARLAGMTGRFFFAGHHPHPLRASVLREYYEANGDVLREQLKFKFRDISQHYTISMANNIEIAEKDTPFYPGVKISYIRAGMKRSLARVINQICFDLSPFGCIQDFGSLPKLYQEEIRRILCEKFNKTLPVTIFSMGKE